MNKKQLNSDIKKLGKLFSNNSIDDSNFKDFEKEYKRLYYCDDKFEYLNKNSILILLRINLRYRFIQLHMFGINIEIN